ncbi:IS1182 family transposase [Caldimonas brevitalea]|nr:IS1182 family transposase [Caldimonas brevitalea]
MLKPAHPKQCELEMVTLEELVPADHLLRHIERHIDFGFIRVKTAHLYSADNGRPALDPVALFKMLFIGYLFGIRSERRLVKEIEVNVAYRWFAGLNLTERVPDASTFSQNRRRRFAGTGIEQEIFDGIVEQALQHGLIGGQVLYTDSTHLKANANKNRFEVHQVDQKPAAYLAELDAAVEQDRQAHGKGPLPPKPPKSETREVKVSTTDADAGYMTREGKPQGFFYLDHRTVDGKHAIITDTHVTPGNVHDSQPYLRRLDRQCERFALTPEAVGLDAGYMSALICHGLQQRALYGVIGYRRPSHQEGYFYKRQYSYDAAREGYVCPAGQFLPYRTTNRMGYREYHSDPARCGGCPQRGQCTKSATHTKVVVRHVWDDAKERVDQHRLSERGKRIYARRKETVERSFADAKELHGQRYARFRGLERVRAQCLMAAAAQNIKKIARLLAQLLRSFSRHHIRQALAAALSSPCRLSLCELAA